MRSAEARSGLANSSVQDHPDSKKILFDSQFSKKTCVGLQATGNWAEAEDSGEFGKVAEYLSHLQCN